MAEVRGWIDDYHKVKDHLEKISEINRELLRRQRAPSNANANGKIADGRSRHRQIRAAPLSCIYERARPPHELPSFARYLNKVFDFRTTVAALTDSRLDPEISPSAVFAAAFHPKKGRLVWGIGQSTSASDDPANEELTKRGAESQFHRSACVNWPAVAFIWGQNSRGKPS
jgi:hypothetical protein